MQKNISNNYSRGFIALTSAIIIAAILLAVVVAGSTAGFYERAAMLDAELKAQSRYNAQSCIGYAALGLLYAGYQGGTYQIGPQDSCSVAQVTTDATQANFVARGTSGKATTVLRVVYDLIGREVTQEEEIPN